MPLPLGFRHTLESRKSISDALRLAHKEGRHRWSNERRKLPYSDLPHTQRIRRRLIDAMGGKCIKCGFSDWRALQVDHINGDGRKERASRRNTRIEMNQVINQPDRYQLLCANCNWIKRYENGECDQDLTSKD